MRSNPELCNKAPETGTRHFGIELEVAMQFWFERAAEDDQLTNS
ncbi:MAG: hypothetical protein OXC68_03085 [Aestuariivita sp.]|nr:hypothetical protein [Aestuariivita sp.]